MWSVLQAIKRSWFKHLITQLTSLFILTATYSVALFIILSTNNIKNIFNIWGKVNEISIYLKEGHTEQQSKELQTYLANHEIVQGIKYESSSESAAAFRQKFQQMSSQKIDEKNISQFFPALFKVELKKSYIYRYDQMSLENFSTTVEQRFNFVSEVSYGKAWLSKYEKLISAFENLSWLIVSVILFASLFVSSNVIKTVLYAKKDEVEILEFIGASPVWILGPHLLNVCLLSAFSFFIAAILNFSVFTVAIGKAGEIFSLSIVQELQFIGPASILMYFIFLLLGVCGYSIMSMNSLLPYRRQKTILVEGMTK